jgi:hypothetical protein
MLEVPTRPVANQQLQVQLAGQACTIVVRQNLYGLFMDLTVNDSLVIAGVICQNLNRIVRDLYFGFIGDFVFVDTQGSSDPVYTGLGTRWLLIYLEAADLPAGEG